ncbi:MAG: DNA polymerase III subunit delta, partial [Gammaproteobacteria bacterium]|nr:DNA polymerase III subunit delta [Gammaproteobacteria bacterium]
MRQRGLVPAPGVAEMLAERSEGNLLACVQEIEKILLLQGAGPVSAEQVGSVVADSARFDVYGLTDTVLAGAAGRGLRMLHGLRAEGTAASLVLWAIAREARALAAISAGVDAGGRLEALLQAQRVWDKRRPLAAPRLHGPVARRAAAVRGVRPRDQGPVGHRPLAAARGHRAGDGRRPAAGAPNRLTPADARCATCLPVDSLASLARLRGVPFRRR